MLEQIDYACTAEWPVLMRSGMLIIYEVDRIVTYYRHTSICT